MKRGRITEYVERLCEFDLFHRISQTPIILPDCGKYVCLECIATKTESFSKTFKCPFCKTDICEKFIKIHSKKYQAEIIDYYLWRIKSFKKNLKCIEILLRN